MAQQLEDHSGELSCDGHSLSYSFGARTWSIAVSEIRLVAEYTTELGPWADDYLLVFLTAKENGWYEASFYAKGRDEMLTKLGESLGATLLLGLCNSADWKSRIVWPTYLADKPLLDRIPHKTAIGRFRQKWLGASIETVLSDAAKSVFEE